MLSYIRPEIRIIDPIAAFFLSLTMELLDKNSPASAHPCGECRSRQNERREEAGGRMRKNRRKAVA
jgi:hypothetical protein